MDWRYIKKIQPKVFKCKPRSGNARVVKVYDYADYLSASSEQQPNVSISNILDDEWLQIE